MNTEYEVSQQEDTQKPQVFIKKLHLSFDVIFFCLILEGNIKNFMEKSGI